MSDHEELESNVAAWVLGALDRGEAEEVQAHVEGCASCRETVARLQRAVGAMPLAVDEVVPPARLRERVLAAAAASGLAGVAGLAVPFDDVLCACARPTPPHTSTLPTSAVSIRRTDITKSRSPIIVTGRWPDIASSRHRWIAGKCLFGKAVSDL